MNDYTLMYRAGVYILWFVFSIYTFVFEKERTSYDFLYIFCTFQH